jgi:hypothetical protein
MNAKKANELKLKANKCITDGQYAEAMLHLSHAIKLDQNNYHLFSNRSFAFVIIFINYLFYFQIRDSFE